MAKKLSGQIDLTWEDSSDEVANIAGIDKDLIQSVISKTLSEDISVVTKLQGTFTPTGSSMALTTFTATNSPDFLIGIVDNPVGILLRNSESKGEYESPVLTGFFFLELVQPRSSGNHTLFSLDSRTTSTQADVTAAIDYFILALKK